MGVSQVYPNPLEGFATPDYLRALAIGVAFDGFTIRFWTETELVGGAPRDGLDDAFVFRLGRVFIVVAA